MNNPYRCRNLVDECLERDDQLRSDHSLPRMNDEGLLLGGRKGNVGQGESSLPPPIFEIKILHNYASASVRLSPHVHAWLHEPPWMVLVPASPLKGVSKLPVTQNFAKPCAMLILSAYLPMHACKNVKVTLEKG